MYNMQYADSGSRCSFYMIDDDRGFKEFEDKEDAEYARNTQLALAENNLAPKVLSVVGRIRLPENGHYDEQFSGWGYMTEIAEMIGCGGNDCDCGECDDIYENHLPKINRLTSKIEDIGYSFADNHIGNVGYIRRRGRKVLVCIDTGRESVFDETDSDYGDEEECDCYQCQQYREGRNA